MSAYQHLIGTSPFFDKKTEHCGLLFQFNEPLPVSLSLLKVKQRSIINISEARSCYSMATPQRIDGRANAENRGERIPFYRPRGKPGCSAKPFHSSPVQNVGTDMRRVATLWVLLVWINPISYS